MRKIFQLVKLLYTKRINRTNVNFRNKTFALIFILDIELIMCLEKNHQIHLTPANISYNIQIAQTAHDR